METAALIAAFRRLQTADSRRDAIGALVEELTPYEWRALHQITAARTFWFDIIGNLPVELVALVFAYLGPSEPYRLQCVSRQWHRALRSPDVLKKSLQPWLLSTVDIRGNDYGLHKLKAKHIQAFRRGEPTLSFKIATDDPHGYVTLVEDTLIWCCVSRADHTSRAVYLFNIKTWSLQTLNGDARETIQRLFASDQLVGFATTTNICYVWDFASRVKRKFRVPNATLLQTVTCRGRTVACAGCLDEYVLVYIWNYDTQQGRSFTIGYDSALLVYPTPGCDHRHGLALLLQPRDERIIVFADQRCSHHNGHNADKSAHRTSTTIRHSQFTYAGVCVSNSHLTLDDCAVTRFYTQNNRFTPTDRSGRFRISLFDMCLQFDENLNRFTEPSPFTHPGRLWAMSSHFWWEDVSFETFISETAGPETPPVLVHVGTDNKTYSNPLIGPCTIDAILGRLSFSPDPECIGLNDRYIIRALKSSFEILCFSDSPQYVNEHESFFGIGSLTMMGTAQNIK